MSRDFPIKLIHMAETDSTNACAKRMAAEGETGVFAVLADAQTAGRGRLGRSFFSPEGGMYLSVSLGRQEQDSHMLTATTRAAVAVCRAIESACGIYGQIKWVNDVYVEGRKVCGILTEAVTGSDGRASVIVGIGINVRPCAFPQDIRGKAGSLGSQIPIAELAAAVTRELLALWQDGDGSYMEEYRRRSLLTGRLITYREGETVRRGTALGVDDEAGLIVESPSGERTVLRTGEVTIEDF